MKSKKPETTYTLTLTEKQALYIQEACELAGRLSMGQMDYLVDYLTGMDFKQWEGCNAKGTPIERKEVEAVCRELKRLLTGYVYGQYGSISSQPDNIRGTWDIRDVIRHRISWDRYDPNTMGKPWTVNYDTPMHLGDKPLPKIEKL